MTLDTALATLETAGLLRLAQMEPELEYLFRHALIQDAAYESLLKADRRVLHRTVGETLEHLYAHQLEEIAPVLARHFDKAGDDERALHYFTVAGDEAGRVYANAEAILHYSQALEIAKREPTGHPRLLHLFTARGRAYELSDQHGQALENYVEMERWADHHHSPTLRLAALMQRATLYSIPTSLFDPIQGQAACAQALDLAQRLDQREAEAKIHWIRMLLDMNTGHYDQALVAGEQSLALARELNLREQLAFTLNDLGMVYNYRGQRARAQAVRRDARELLRAQGNLPMLTDNLSNSAIAQFLDGQFERAESASAEAYQLSQATANLWGQAYSRGVLGYIYLERGELTRAIDVMVNVLTASAGAGLIMVQAGVNADLAYVYASMGDAERAQERMRLARQYVIDPLPHALRAWGLTSLARYSILTGDLTQAEADLRESYRGVNLNEWVWVTPIIICLAEAELALARHAPVQALTTLDELLNRLQGAQVRAYVPEALYLKGRARLMLNQPEAAYALFAEARAEAETLGVRRALWLILAAMSEIEARRGHVVEAESIRRQAQTTLTYIADHCPSELRESFLSLPQVKQVLGDD